MSVHFDAGFPIEDPSLTSLYMSVSPVLIMTELVFSPVLFKVPALVALLLKLEV